MSRGLWKGLGWMVALGLIAATTGLAAAPSGLAGLTAKEIKFKIDCDKGQSLQQAVNRQDRELVVEFVGTCVEDVVIGRGDVTLRGGDPSATVVGGITIDRVSNVTLQDFSMRDGATRAVFVERASGFSLSGLDVRDFAIGGILLQQSTGTIADTTVVRSGEVGILNRGSQVALIGNVTCNENGIAGISATLGASYSINGANITTNNNVNGFFVQISSGVEFPNGSLTANNNRRSGIVIANEGVFVHGNINVQANNNGLVGLLVTELASWAPFSGFGIQMELKNNVFSGIVVQESSSFVGAGFGGKILVAENRGPGVQIDGSKVTFGNFELRDNLGDDIRLTFGTRAAFGFGNRFGKPVFCDSTVLTRGLLGCGGTAGTSAAEASATSAEIGSPLEGSAERMESEEQ